MAQIKTGDKVPDFKCPSTGAKEVSLLEFKDRQNVVLVFYVAAFTPVCAHELLTIQLNYGRFEQNNTAVLGISCDTIWANQMFSASLGGLVFPLLGDHKKEIAKSFGILRNDGFCERATYIIDKKGVIKWFKIHKIEEPRDFDEIFAQLEKMKNEN